MISIVLQLMKNLIQSSYVIYMSISKLGMSEDDSEQSILEFEEEDDSLQDPNSKGNTFKIMESLMKNKNRKERMHDYDLDLQYSFEGNLKKQFIKQECIKQEPQSTIWNPVVYQSQQGSTKGKKLKFQYHQNSLYPTKIIQRRKKFKSLDMNNPQQAKSLLQQLAKEYHKNLLDQVMEQQRIKQQSGVKDQDEIINLDKSLNKFPIYNPSMKEKNYKSIDQLTQFLRDQEEEIVKQINDESVSSVFVKSFQIITKPSQSSKEYINLKCKISGCQAILKCVCTVQNCQLYTFRNRHNHTITGEIILQTIKPSETITLDQELHDMFGFNKGVRSETRNTKYADRETRKQQRKQYAKMRRHQRMEVQQPQQRQERIKKKRICRLKANAKRAIQIEFVNMSEQLEQQGFRVYAFSNERKESPFAQLLFLSLEQMIKAYKSSTVLRITVIEQCLRLDKKKHSNNCWQVGLITTYNCALNSLVIGVVLTDNKIAYQYSKIVPLILKTFPATKYLVMDYQPQITNSMDKLCEQNNIRLLLDSDDLFSLLKREIKDHRNQPIIKEMLIPSSTKIAQYLMFFKDCKQIAFIEKVKTLMKYFVSFDAQKPYLQFEHHLRQQKQMAARVKAKLRGGLNRYSLKYQTKNLMDVISSINKESSEEVQKKLICNIELQRVHQDMGLLMVRQSVCSKLISHFYQEYCKQTLLKFKEQENSLAFEDGNMVKNWGCTCAYLRLSGIPCKHLIIALKKERKNYLGLFHQKWIINDHHLSEQEIPINKYAHVWNILKDIQLRNPAQAQFEQLRSRSRDKRMSTREKKGRKHKSKQQRPSVQRKDRKSKKKSKCTRQE